MSKAISPVVAMALLLVVAVVAAVSFQGWFQQYNSEIFTSAESQDVIGEFKVGGAYGKKIYLDGDEQNITTFSLEGINSNVSCSLAQLERNNLPREVGYWDFEHANETHIMDQSGYGNHAEIKSNLSFAPGIVDKAGDFREDNQSHLEVPQSSSLNVSGNFTMSLWLKREGNSSMEYPFLFVFEATKRYYGIRTLSYGSTISFEYARPPYDNTNWSTILPQGIPLRSWDHYVYTYNGTHVTGYVNAEPISGPVEAEIRDDISYLTINDEARHFKGYMDEVKLFNGSMEKEQIGNLYHFNRLTLNNVTQIDVPGCLGEEDTYELVIGGDTGNLIQQQVVFR